MDMETKMKMKMKTKMKTKMKIKMKTHAEKFLYFAKKMCIKKFLIFFLTFSYETDNN